MCGIAGIAHSEAGGVDQHLVRQMCSRIARRGADGDGFYFDDWVGLGMRRLAIIDVQTGQQPIANETQSVWRAGITASPHRRIPSAWYTCTRTSATMP